MSKTSHFVAAVFLASLGAASAQAPENKFKHVLSIGGEGTGEGQFKYVEDFAFAKDGSLLVTDASHAFVQAFDSKSGKFLGRFGGKGDDENNFEKPEGIAVDEDGNIFVADYSTGFIKKHDASFKLLQVFSGYGSELGQTIKAEFMDVRNGRLYVPDAGNHRVNVFSLSGSPLFNFGSAGSEPGNLNNPEAAKFDSTGKLFVTDLKNNRVQVFDGEGRLLFIFGKEGDGRGEFRAPAGLSFDARDNVYVTELANNRVQVFTNKGAFLATFGRKGPAEGEFSNPHGIIVERATGRIFVADTGNNRIQVFDPGSSESVGRGQQ